MSLNSLASDTDALYCGASVLQNFDASFRACWPGKDVYLIADENTLPLIPPDVVGCELLRHPFARMIFPSSPVLEPLYDHSLSLRKAMGSLENVIPVVVGSGTLNDLTKCAASEIGREYAVIATAASVDGYASDGAALVKGGIKQTFPCPAPKLIFGDTEILGGAPPEMTASGYADLAAKITAGADWILSDLLGEDPIDETVWGQLHGQLKNWLSNPDQLKKGDAESLENLFQGLNESGFAMQYLKKSRPASGAEHLISHILEMQHYEVNGVHPSHGFKVALGTLCSLKAMHWLMDRGIGSSDIERAEASAGRIEQREGMIERLFPYIEDHSFLYEVNHKEYASPDHVIRRLSKIQESWENVYRRWQDFLPKEDTLTSDFEIAGCPSRPGDLGLRWSQLGELMVQAQFLRARYTILDLLYDLDLQSEFQEFLNTL